MSKVRKSLCLFLVAVLLMAILAGCGGAADETTADTMAAQTTTGEKSTTADVSKPDTSKEVNLQFYFAGDKPNSEDGVLAEINKITKEKINTTMTIKHIPWSDWANQYMLIFASGEEFDAVNTGAWCLYSSVANKNGFMEITKDMLSQNAPNILKEFPDEAWKQCKINGKVFMIPTSINYTSGIGIAVRGDLRKKYGAPEIKSLDDFGTYLDEIAKNEKGLVPFNLSGNYDILTLTTMYNTIQKQCGVGSSLLYNLVFKYDGDSVDIQDSFTQPEFRDFVKKMKQWKDAGYWSKNALTNQTPDLTSMKAGQSAALVTNILQLADIQQQWKTEHPDWEEEVFDGAFGGPVLQTAYFNNGLAIHASSKNAERVLMFADLARSDREMSLLVNFGIKGTDYNLIGEDKFEYVKGSDYSQSAFTWCLTRTDFQLGLTNVYPQYDSLYKTLWDNSKTHMLQGFNINDANIKNEMAALSNVISQYATPLLLGFIDDPDKGVDTLNEKMKAAGMEKVLADVKAQADEFAKNFSQPAW